MPREETIQARRHRQSLIPRACAACKFRKIRCDRSIPCANCQTSGIACQQAANVGAEGRAKVDRTEQLEKYVERLEQRLSSVEALLKQPVPSVSPSDAHSTSSQTDPGVSTLVQGDAVYEGNPSFTTASVQASALAQKTASSETPHASLELTESFIHLDSLLQPSHALPAAGDHWLSKGLTSCSIPAMDLLPLHLVIAILQKVKADGSVFLMGYSINDVSLVEALCQSVYFPTKPVSVGHVTAMHGVLRMLLQEVSRLDDTKKKPYDLEPYISQCERNFNTGIETYSVLAVPSFENILALNFAIIIAQNEAKPSLSCSFMSAAVTHCHALGYHRESTYQRDASGNSENKRRLFWTLYIFDKNLSLLLGRTSSMQDIDIDARYPSPSSDPGRRPWDYWFLLAIRLAKVQGEIYNGLYSASAQQSTNAQRKEQIRKLTPIMHQWRVDLDLIDASQIKYPQIFELSKTHWDIMYYSTLTTLLRGSMAPATGAEIHSECFQAARLSLESHLRCLATYHTSAMLSDQDFANWVLHSSSFTPFLVIFLHAIATGSLQDVQLLDEVVESLRCTRKAGKSSERLYQICDTFGRLARQMVETKNSCAAVYDEQADTLELGRMPETLEGSFHEPPDSEVPVDQLDTWMDFDASVILSEWINGQQSATNLLNMDFTDL